MTRLVLLTRPVAWVHMQMVVDPTCDMSLPKGIEGSSMHAWTCTCTSSSELATRTLQHYAMCGQKYSLCQKVWCLYDTASTASTSYQVGVGTASTIKGSEAMPQAMGCALATQLSNRCDVSKGTSNRETLRRWLEVTLPRHDQMPIIQHSPDISNNPVEHSMVQINHVKRCGTKESSGTH